MTLTLELPADLEAQISTEARARGVAPEVIALEKMSARHDETPEDKRLRIKSAIEEAQNYFSQFPTVGGFLEEKHADTARENARSYGGDIS